MKIIKISEVEGTVMNDDQRFVGSVNFKNLIDDKVSPSFWAFSADFPPGHRSVPHTHNTDQILYFTEGKGVVGTDTEEHEVTAGTLVFIPAGQRHYHGATSTTACSHLAVLLEGPDSTEKE
jgi:quercetin dioxygenase-like cupin family protein